METPEGKVSLLDTGSSMNGCAGFYCRRVCLLIFMSALKNMAVLCGA